MDARVGHNVVNNDRVFVDMMQLCGEAEILSDRDASNILLEYVTTDPNTPGWHSKD